MSDELRKAALKLIAKLDEWPHYVRDVLNAQEALRAALAEPDPKKCDCTGFGHNPACPVSLSNLAATISRRHDATEPSREPTQEMIRAAFESWADGCGHSIDRAPAPYIYRMTSTALMWKTWQAAYAAGHKAGSGT